MKKIGLIAVAVGLLTAGKVSAAGNTNTLLMNIQLTALIQQLSNVTNGSVQTSTYTTTSAKVSNPSILSLLQAEYGTLFPTGAQLGYKLSGTHSGTFVVLDQNGNEVLNTYTNSGNTNFVFALSNSVAGAGSPQVVIGKIVNNTATTNATEVITAYQPDYGIYYRDGNGNDFHIDGLLTLKANLTQSPSNTIYNAVSFTIGGAGGGTFYNPGSGQFDTAVFTKLKITAAGQQIVQ